MDKPYKAKERAAVNTYKPAKYIPREFINLTDLYEEGKIPNAVTSKESATRMPKLVIRHHDEDHSLLSVVKAYLCLQGSYRVTQKIVTKEHTKAIRYVKNSDKNRAKYPHAVLLPNDKLAVEFFGRAEGQVVQSLEITADAFLPKGIEPEIAKLSDVGNGVSFSRAVIEEAAQAYKYSDYGVWRPYLMMGVVKDVVV